MKLEQLFNEKKEILKVEKKLRKLIDKKDLKARLVMTCHALVNFAFWISLFSGKEVVGAGLVLFALFGGIALFILTVFMHSKVLRVFYKKQNKYNDLFDYQDQDGEDFIKKHKKYLNIYKEKNKDKHNLFKTLLIDTLKKSKKRDILFHEKEIKKSIEPLHKVYRDEIRYILEDKMEIKRGKHEFDYIFKENKELKTIKKQNKKIVNMV